jgi:hypothetical protein
MAHDAVVTGDYPFRRLEAVPRRVGMAALVLLALGALAFLAVLFTDAERAWRAYMYNWLYFTGIAQGAVMLAAITTIAKGLWAQPIRRIALSFVAFLPISFVLFIPLLLVGDHLFPWIEHPIPAKEPYLNMPFLAARNLILLGALFSVSILFAYTVLRPDIGGRAADAPPRLRRLYGRFSGAWRGQLEEEHRAFRRVSTIAPILGLLYAVALTIVAFDFVMSLEPHWFSTLIGGYFFMGALLSGVAATAVAAVIYRAALGLEDVIQTPNLHDLGKLTFAFSIFWAYLLWSHYIVIWYGKIPHDQEFLIHRMTGPFFPVSLIVFFLIFVLPFTGLLSVSSKRNPATLALFAASVLTGIWIERYLLTYPSWYIGTQSLPFGWMEVGVALGFAGLLIAALLFFATRFPMVQLWRPLSELELTGEAPLMDATVPLRE